MNGKQKGSEFERTISKRLSLWWSDGADDNLFWRTQNSGGRFTSRLKKGQDTKNQEGDISSTSELSQDFSKYICVECKAYKDINLWSLISRKGLLWDWWVKHCECAKQVNKHPMLICKQNNKPILCIIDEELCSELIVGYKIVPRFCSHTEPPFHVHLLDDILAIPSSKFKKSLDLMFGEEA